MGIEDRFIEHGSIPQQREEVGLTLEGYARKSGA